MQDEPAGPNRDAGNFIISMDGTEATSSAHRPGKALRVPTFRQSRRRLLFSPKRITGRPTQPALRTLRPSHPSSWHPALRRESGRETVEPSQRPGDRQARREAPWRGQPSGAELTTMANACRAKPATWASRMAYYDGFATCSIRHHDTPATNLAGSTIVPRNRLCGVARQPNRCPPKSGRPDSPGGSGERPHVRPAEDAGPVESSPRDPAVGVTG